MRLQPTPAIVPISPALKAFTALTLGLMLAACGGGQSASNPTTSAQALAPTVTPGVVSEALSTTSADKVQLSCSPLQVVSPGGRSSCNLQWVGRYPIPGLTVGGRLVGNRFYLTNWTSGFHVFDVSDPENPIKLGSVTMDGGSGSLVQSLVENEDTATNGQVAILSRTAYQDALVLDVRNPQNMRGVAVPGANAHTHTCLNNCQWSYGSTTGVILDLRNPTLPVLQKQKWSDLTGVTNAHDLTEIRPGLVIAASDPAMVIDTTNPAQPKALFALPRTVAPSNPVQPSQGGRIGHNVIWPRQGADRFFMGISEGPYAGRCELYAKEGRTLSLYDTTDWAKKKSFTLLSQYTLVSGNADTGADGGIAQIDSRGNPSIVELGVQGCSAHWFEPNPTFNNGGLVAMASFSHGMRLLNVQRNGRIDQLGYFVSSGTAGLATTVDVRWISERVMYVLDFASGAMDVLKYTGPLPGQGPLDTSHL